MCPAALGRGVTQHATIALLHVASHRARSLFGFPPNPGLQSDCLDVAEQAGGRRLAASPPARRLCATLQATLGLSAALQDAMGVRREPEHALRLHRGQQALAAALSSPQDSRLGPSSLL